MKLELVYPFNFVIKSDYKLKRILKMLEGDQKPQYQTITVARSPRDVVESVSNRMDRSYRIFTEGITTN